jgi:2-hydroxy-6-oxonona-2,4-dienedioate hydrolase
LRRIPKSQLWLFIMLGVSAGAWAKITGARRSPSERRDKAKTNSMWLTVNGMRMHALARKECDETHSLPVVFIHGFGVSGRYFIPAMHNLAVRFPVYAPDLPGHGLSQSPDRAMNIKGLACALVAWMDAAGIGRAMLIGHSMGCQIAVELAVSHPEKADRIVLIGMPPEPAIRNPLIQLVRLLRCIVHERPSLIPCVLKDYIRMNWRVVPEFFFMLRYSVLSALPELTVPVMLVRGEHDALSPAEWFEESAGLVSTACTAIIPDAAHAVHYSASERSCAALELFLNDAGVSEPNMEDGAEGEDEAGHSGSSRPGPWHLSEGDSTAAATRRAVSGRTSREES